MPLSAIIVDDEPLARQELEYLLHELGGTSIVAQGANGIEAVDLIPRHRPDLVFLDVQMPGLDGFAVIKKLLDRKQPLPQIVFATAYDEYAVRAFEVNAVDYLLKPFSRRRVAQAIEKARARIVPTTEQRGSTDVSVSTDTATKLDALLKLVEEQASTARSQASVSSVERPSGKVIVRTQNRLLLVDQREICFATIEGGTISVVTGAVEGVSNFRTLEDFMAALDPETFWRAHRSHVVNIQHIREVVPWFKSSYQLRMDDPKKTELPVSRAQTKKLRELFNL